MKYHYYFNLISSAKSPDLLTLLFMKTALTTCFILLFLSLHCRAQTEQEVEIKDLEEYLYRSAMNNPNLRAKFNGYLTSMKRIPQARALPDPDFVYGQYILPIETRNGTILNSFSLSQTFPFFGLLKAQKEAAFHISRAKYFEFSEAKTDLFFELKENWYEFFELRKSQEVISENLELLKYLEQLALKKYETNQGSMVDVIRVQLEKRELENQLEILKLEEKPLLVRFNTMLNRERYKAIQLPEVIHMEQIDTSHLMDSILIRNSNIRRLEAEQASARELQKVARLNGMPTFRIGILYGWVRPIERFPVVDNGQDILLPSIGLNLPIYRKKYKAMKRQADYRLEDLRDQKDEARNALYREAEIAQMNLKEGKLRIELYQQQTVQSEQALNLLLTEFSTAGKNFEEVLRMQQQILNYELKLVKAYIQYNTAVARLKKLLSE